MFLLHARRLDQAAELLFFGRVLPAREGVRPEAEGVVHPAAFSGRGFPFGKQREARLAPVGRRPVLHDREADRVWPERETRLGRASAAVCRAKGGICALTVPLATGAPCQSASS